MGKSDKTSESLTFMDQYDFTENDSEILLKRWFPENKPNSEFEANLKEILGDNYTEHSK